MRRLVLPGAQQVTGVQQRVNDLGMLTEATADRGGDILARAPAQPRLLGQPDLQTHHAAHAIGTRRDRQPYAEQLTHALLDAAQRFVTVDRFDAGDQRFFLFARQPQHADVGLVVALPRVQQLPLPALAGAGRAFFADGEGQRCWHGEVCGDGKSILP